MFFVSLMVFGLWRCLINQCFILSDNEVQKLPSLIIVTCQTNERDSYFIRFVRICGTQHATVLCSPVVDMAVCSTKWNM
jgi:hypothetical protein